MLQRGEYYRTHKHSQRDDMLAHGERMAKLVRSLPFGATCANIGMKIGKALGVFAVLLAVMSIGVIVALVVREVLALFHRWPIVPHARPLARSPCGRTSCQRPSRWGPCVKYSPT